MEKKTISQSIEMRASKEAVWKILTQQPSLDDWSSAFMSGAHVEGRFEEGERILYLDPSGVGVVGEVVECVPHELLKVSILAEITNNKPDFDNPDSKRWPGSYDLYRISEQEGVAVLTVESVFPAEFYDDFVEGWHKMLARFKELAEKQ